ncbi:hypothetical protein C8J55DRAFT_494400 [Lentinula edodes]|uniref:Uncharacterized protein n=1 Tax=Lentinula lateritia TaxID=40482 RepID=A0A9W8ZR40_9AGAR|nr:hypothetical protein C8J55DRAFT_494400 [Lentinula edodes]
MTAKPERLVMTEEAFPDIYPYLTPRDIRLFNSSQNRQQHLLQEWKACHSSKSFLSNIPAQELPKHFFPPPKERASVLFYCGWRITYKQLYEVAMKEYPEEVVSIQGKIDTIFTCMRLVPRLAKDFNLPTLVLKRTYCGPRMSDRAPFLAMCHNYFATAQRQEILESEGVEKLKELLKLNDTVWVVDERTHRWPRAFKGMSLRSHQSSQILASDYWLLYTEPAPYVE